MSSQCERSLSLLRDIASHNRNETRVKCDLRRSRRSQLKQLNLTSFRQEEGDVVRVFAVAVAKDFANEPRGDKNPFKITLQPPLTTFKGRICPQGCQDCSANISEGGGGAAAAERSIRKRYCKMPNNPPPPTWQIWHISRQMDTKKTKSRLLRHYISRQQSS